ncbi:MAG TPA: hypothetical protein VFN55_15590 [Solirubrobacteraceae bacterium]|nr:hypothetical protein [Solirubrobacteraceae bacterium]
MGRRQNQQVTRAQLLAIGLGRDAITHRASHGMLFRTYHAVFSLVPPPLTPLQRASAAVLACGPDGALGDGSALALWWPGRPWPDIPTVVGTARRKHPGIRVRQVRGLTRADVRVHHGIRVTSPARTLLDCARELGERTTARLLAEARRAGLVHPASLNDVLARFPRHRGRATLLAVIHDPAARARSEFEVLFPEFCARYGLPSPVINARVHGRERDAYFPDQRLIVELDGWAFHQDRVSFEDDRERDAEALAAGLGTYRLTWSRFTGTPEREAQRLAAILVNRGWSPPARSAPGP